MANKSTQKQWKTRVETPSAPYSAPSTFFSRLLPSAGRGRGKNGPVPLHSRGLPQFHRCRCSAEVKGQVRKAWCSATFFRRNCCLQGRLVGFVFGANSRQAA
jgi:hypothetical protein